VQGVLYFKDFGVKDGYKNCFHICALTNKCSISQALRIIDRDFNLGFFNHNSMVEIKSSIKYDIPTNINKSEQKEVDLYAELRPFIQSDLNYFLSGGISESTLKIFNVRAVEKAWINEAMWHKYSILDPIYRYREEKEIKFYRPFAQDKKNKFRSNYSISVECMHELNYKTSNLFLTKSRKDVMSLFEVGFESVSIRSETADIDADILEHLKNSYDRIIVFYDNDEPGVKSSIELTQQYGLEYFNIPKGLPKDPFAFIQQNSKEELWKLIHQRCFASK
jgi:hypothetical protein